MISLECNTALHIARNLKVKTKDIWQKLLRKPIKTVEYGLVVSVNTNEGPIKYQVTTTKLNAGR